MDLSSKSKSCPTKARQKTFFLNQNRASSCCRADSDDLDQSLGLDFYLQKWEHERELLASGIEIPGCEDCWRYERLGQTSRRLTSNDQNKIELFFSNLCNQMCSYCSPKFSSVWEDSIRNQGSFENISYSAQSNHQVVSEAPDVEFWIKEIEQYIQRCDNDSVSLKILGGEPLMQQRNLQRMLYMNFEKIKILDIHTNLNPPTSKFLHWLLDTVPAQKLKFSVSIDASPGFNHWPRAKFEQSRFEQNFNLLREKQIALSISPVISVISVFDLPNFLSWLDRHNLVKPNWIRLRNPECLDPAYIPNSWRQKIFESIKNTNTSQILEEILIASAVDNKLRLIEQHNYLTQYFQRNKLDPRECHNQLFQEYWSWLTKNYKT